MRRRLVSTYVLLLCLVLVAFAVPLASSVTGRETERMVADRIADATRFASLAAPALRTGELQSVLDELRRYHELYGIGTVLVDQNQKVIATGGLDPFNYGADAVTRAALAGRMVGTPDTLWPWQRSPLVVAVPISDGGAVLGAVVTVSPTWRSRRAVLWQWGELGGIGIVALAVAIFTALWLASWVLRPVTRLDEAAHRIAAGDEAVRVQPGLGPPELRRLSVSFNEMADAVAEVLERQRSFVAHASHQLRNPLTVLRLRVESLGGELVDDEARADHCLALEETDRLAAVLDGLLTLAQAERGQYRTEVVDAVATAWSRRLAWLPLIEKRRIDLRVAAPDTPRYARLVVAALDQSLDALIDNALKFTPPGGRVEVEVTTRDQGVGISVRDTGPGMNEEQCGRATERFWRAPDAQNVDGAGLGLPIVAVLMEASGGRLELGRAPSGGLEARLWAPAASAAEVAAAEVTA